MENSKLTEEIQEAEAKLSRLQRKIVMIKKCPTNVQQKLAECEQDQKAMEAELVSLRIQAGIEAPTGKVTVDYRKLLVCPKDEQTQSPLKSNANPWLTVRQTLIGPSPQTQDARMAPSRQYRPTSLQKNTGTAQFISLPNIGNSCYMYLSTYLAILL